MRRASRPWVHKKLANQFLTWVRLRETKSASVQILVYGHVIWNLGAQLCSLCRHLQAETMLQVTLLLKIAHPFPFVSPIKHFEVLGSRSHKYCFNIQQNSHDLIFCVYTSMNLSLVHPLPCLDMILRPKTYGL